jgi:hypothetical protein
MLLCTPHAWPRRLQMLPPCLLLQDRGELPIHGHFAGRVECHV